MELINAINSPLLQDKLILFRVIFGGVGIVFLVFYIYAAYIGTPYMRWVRGSDFIEFWTFRSFGLRPRRQEWNKIRKRLEKRAPGEAKLTIFEAERMMSKLFTRMGIKGKTFEEQLNNTPISVVPNKEHLSTAHKMRSNTIYDPDYRLSYEEANRILDLYEETLRNLDVL